jgi:hypothetical protein
MRWHRDVVIALSSNELVIYHMNAPTASGDIEYRLIRQGGNTHVENTISIKAKAYTSAQDGGEVAAPA